MVIIFINQQSLSAEDVDLELCKLSNYVDDNNLGVSSFYVQMVTKDKVEAKIKIIHGVETLTETLTMDGKTLKFNISPNAFFQINTKAAELCYAKIADLLDMEAGKETVLLDICCGTGTIGLCLASQFKHVFGIEYSSDAVKDAKVNAAVNNVSNITFYDGKAESILPLVIQSVRKNHPEAKILAVLDPPRAGLNSSVIKSLRSNDQISKLVYVSCEPLLAKHNLIEWVLDPDIDCFDTLTDIHFSLVRPASKSFRGEPFIPIKSVLVDMFPDTKRAETLFLFERLKRWPWHESIIMNDFNLDIYIDEQQNYQQGSIDDGNNKTIRMVIKMMIDP